jgi:HAD superfamily hydrolase (TIGR01509 family)
MSPSRACLLFDVDGTLVDTDPVHIIAFNEICRPHGVEVDEETYRQRISGRINPVIFAELLPHVPDSEYARLSWEKEARFRALAGEMHPVPGLIALLEWARSVALPCALVSNAPRDNVEFVIDAIDIRAYFQAMVLADDLSHAKPHPLPYLTGLEKMGAAAGASVAFEDSKSGVQSAAGAALGVVGITTSIAPDILKSHGAALTVPDYTDPALMAFIRERTGRR